ncbi:NAD(P)/FAD-dependent oxidoreductase [Reichenbachiella agarivorans]|uniref:NAD(P)/FAD-dependent oxidoreductase n=1 Tax=Reichenbachiella agarivorans TaxID=2979464 RepID=A0ABY6CLU5_9BACT|nr:NAD(P)/FAD-dependent oxidoreductase [Reichenbachiella agarivorans]UXP31472.1 NAD(P)/FAD-dependent oxidoreductase [Reichenbachiella agarivorans]
MKVAVIGGGAAGFFAALSCKVAHTQAQVDILEASGKTLSKVKVSGGGRCNVTNGCESNADFLRFYPRGSKVLKKTFGHFDRLKTIDWFAQRGVELKTEADGRMFPVTNDSQTIIDCLRDEARKLGVEVVQNYRVSSITPTHRGFELFSKAGNRVYDYLIIAAGGNNKPESYDWLRQLGHAIIPPVPSLFTFNIPSEKKLTLLSGVAMTAATVKIQGTKLAEKGPLLVTHWGLSGPAALRLSAWGARILHDLNYQFSIQINWTQLDNEAQVRERLESVSAELDKKLVSNINPFDLPKRLWSYLLDRVEVDESKRWMEVAKKDRNRLINVLCNDVYKVEGKTTFKEEFVTCGGVDTAEVDFNTMESRQIKGLYFAGEVLDIDGVTGGFNFQAAWSTGYVAGLLGGKD